MGVLDRLKIAGASKPEGPPAPSDTPPTKRLLSSLGFSGTFSPDVRRIGPPTLPPVGASEDLTRILALPRRARPSLVEQQHMADEMTARLSIENRDCKCASLRKWQSNPCIKKLFPVQGWYLYEAAQCNGALGHVMAGGGKTGIDILLAMAVPNVKRAVLLLPPQLRIQFVRDYELWSQHFRTPNLVGARWFTPGRPTLEMLAYSELSHESCTTWLESNQPDVLIEDEAHNLKNPQSVRGNRFVRYFAETKKEPYSFAHSGTLTTRSPSDYAHLSAICLREGSPLPIDPNTTREWCGALEANTNGPPAPPGELRRLCTPTETARDGFRRRLIETRGVIVTHDNDLEARIVIHARKPPTMPDAVKSALELVRRRSQRPDGEELTEKMDVAKVAKQVSSGFFYRWKYPRGEPESLILEWLRVRKSWNRELAERMEHRSPGMDSPKLLTDAAERSRVGYRGELPVWRAEHWAAWHAIEEKVQPVRETVWISDWLARDAVEYGKEAPSVIWYLSTAWGARVAELGGFELCAEGTDASERIAALDGTRTIVASIKAHGTGKNLQMYSRCLIAHSPTDGWEQLLARHHRHGQTAGVVGVDVYRHTPEAAGPLESARELALYVQTTTGAPQRLLMAEFKK